MVDPIDYHLLLKHPARDEPEEVDFTSFTGEVARNDVLSLGEKGEWRVEEVEHVADLTNPRLVCVPT